MGQWSNGWSDFSIMPQSKWREEGVWEMTKVGNVDHISLIQHALLAQPFPACTGQIWDQTEPPSAANFWHILIVKHARTVPCPRPLMSLDVSLLALRLQPVQLSLLFMFTDPSTWECNWGAWKCSSCCAATAGTHGCLALQRCTVEHPTYSTLLWSSKFCFKVRVLSWKDWRVRAPRQRQCFFKFIFNLQMASNRFQYLSCIVTLAS